MQVFGFTKQALIERNYKHIYNHELAHKTAGGQYAGEINIQKDSEGVPVSGYVPIRMPVLDRNNPQKTINHADTVIKAALAPSDPSEQDYKVAAQAGSIKSQAQNLKSSNKLNVLA